MEATIVQNIDVYDVSLNQETTEMIVNVVNETIVFETVIEQLGTQGFSAFDIAIQEGFVGSKAEWNAQNTNQSTIDLLLNYQISKL